MVSASTHHLIAALSDYGVGGRQDIMERETEKGEERRRRERYGGGVMTETNDFGAQYTLLSSFTSCLLSSCLLSYPLP